MGCNEIPAAGNQNDADAKAQRKIERARIREKRITNFAMMKWILFDSKIDARAGQMTTKEALEDIKRKQHKKGYVKELLSDFGIKNLKKP